MEFDMVNQNRPAWFTVLASVLWLIVTLGGLTLIQPLLVILFGLGSLMASGDPTAVTMDKYRIISARLWGVFLYGAVWLAGIIFANSWFLKSKTMSTLLSRFGLVAVVEIAIWGLGIAVQEMIIG
jgi:hypothetical protein